MGSKSILKTCGYGFDVGVRICTANMRLRWKEWLGNSRGNVAMITALCALPLAGVICGVLEIQDIAASRGNLQAAVDAGALAGAQRLGVANTSTGDIQSAAIAAADANLPAAFHASRPIYAVSTDPSTDSVTLAATAEHTPLIGLMGLGATPIHATATADALGTIPLCILQTGTDQKAGMNIKDHALIRATGCAVQSNKDISVDPNAMIQAARTQAAGTIKGPVSPAGFAGALTVADPFAAMKLDPPLNCIGKPLNLKVLTYMTLVLLPGVHCEQYEVETGATLQLLPGDHWFMNDVNAHDNALIQGDDVVMLFDSNKKVNFFDKAQVRLSARKAGPFAGFLIATTRNNTQQFTIASDNVSQLLGTIYIPNAQLVIDTTGNVAQDSAWSIIVADSIQMQHNPNLVINTNYIGSGVPVPDGVGPSQKVSLVK